MTALKDQHCESAVTGLQVLGREQASDFADLLDPEWHINPNANAVERLVRFNNYYEVMAFTNAVAWMAHIEDHHPDMLVSYNRCQLTYSTHAAGGLTENDFICAAKVDALLE